MAVNLGKAVAYLDLDTSGFKNGIKTAKTDLKTFSSSTSTTSDKLKSVSSVMGSTGKSLTKYITTPIVGIGTASVKTAMDFEKQMARVKSISGATGKDFESLEKMAKKMGATTIFTSQEAATAMEYMGMAGWKSEQMIAGLPGIMDLAAASGEDLGLVSDIVTDAITAFGLSAEDTSHFVDVLAAAATNSNTNVSMLGESFKYAAPVAGALGYSIEDVGVALGLMANSGIKASQGGTALRALFTNLAKPTGESAKAVEYLDLSLTNADGSMKSFKEICDELRSKFGELKMPQEEVTKKMQELDDALADGTLSQEEYNDAVEELTKNAFGAADAEKAKYAAMLAGRTGMSGLLAILNTTTEDYEKLTGAINGCEGAASDMAETQRDTLWGSFKLLMSAIDGVAMSIGEYLIPYIRKLADWLTGLVDKFNNLSEEQKDNVVKIGLWIAAIGPVMIIVSKVIGFISLLMDTFGKFGGIVSKVATILTKGAGIASKAGGIIGTVAKTLATAFAAHPIIGAILAIIAVLVTLYLKCEGFRDFVDGLVDFFKDIPDKIVGFFKNLPEKISGVFDSVKKSVGGKLEEIRDTYAGKFNAWQENVNVDGIWVPINNATDKIQGFFNEMSTNSTGSMQEVWKELGNFAKDSGEILSTVLGGLVTFVSNLGEIAVSVLTLQFDEIPEIFGRMGRWIKADVEHLQETFGGLLESGSEIFKNLGKAAGEKLGDIGDFIKETFGIDIGGFFKSAGEKFEKLKSGANEKLIEMGSKITELNKNVSENLPEVFSDVFTKKIPEFFGGVSEKAGQMFDDVVGFFHKSPEEMGYALGEMLGNVVNFFTDFGTNATTFFTETIPEKFEQFTTFLDEGIGGVLEGIGTFVEDAVGSVVEFFESIPEKVGEAFENFGQIYDDFNEWWGEVMESLGYYLGEMAGNIYLFFTETIPEYFEKFFTETIPNFLKNIGEFFTNIGEKWEGFKEDVGKKWDEFWKNVGEGLAEAKENAIKWAKETVDNVIKYISELPKNIKKKLGEAYESFKKWGKETIENAKETGKKILKGIVDKVKDIPKNFKEKLDSTYTKITKWGIEMREKAKEVGKKFVDDLVKNVKSLPKKFIGFVKSIPDKVGDLKDKFIKAGKDIMGGLLDGLKKKWEGIEKWLKSIGDNIGKFFSGFTQGFQDTVNSKSAKAVNGSHAGGLSYVPYDGYVAELHKGERVLTADENRQYQQGSNGYSGSGGDIFNFYNTRPEPYEYYREVKKAKREVAYGF